MEERNNGIPEQKFKECGVYAQYLAPSSGTLIETDDTIEVQGHIFHKPFVEKPISAEDHTVHIYFPSDYGGGCQQLFRKVCK